MKKIEWQKYGKDIVIKDGVGRVVENMEKTDWWRRWRKQSDEEDGQNKLQKKTERQRGWKKQSYEEDEKGRDIKKVVKT